MTSGFHTSTAGNIDIRFTNGTSDDTSGGYKIHPAFYWGGWTIPEGGAMVKQGGGTELTGIWVGKFESSSSSGKIKIIDNVSSWRSITIDSIFTTCLNMKNDTATYGDLSIADTHMIKNSEWGAVAYLSKYALGVIEVAYNPSSSFTTGNGNIVTYKAESTTGTEYGIYDMSGGAFEYVVAYIDNTYADDYGNSAYAANAQYKDVFPKSASDGTDGSGNYAGISQAYGHAIYETSNGYNGTTSWFNDYSCMPLGSSTWLLRSGGFIDNTNAGMFYFRSTSGNSNNNYGFRVGICVT